METARAETLASRGGRRGYVNEVKSMVWVFVVRASGIGRDH
jgi:hypothetical protein